MPKRPRAPIDEYIEVRPLLRLTRMMERFAEVLDNRDDLRPYWAEVREEFRRLLNEELAPHAATLAFALVELEDAYPEIDRGSDS